MEIIKAEAIMCDKIEVAVREENGDFVLHKGIDRVCVPWIFGPGDRITHEEFLKFLEDRVVPPDRVGIDDILKDLGLVSYTLLSVASKTKASLIEDPWWVKFTAHDSFENDTMRGAAGLEPWDYSDLSSASRGRFC